MVRMGRAKNGAKKSRKSLDINDSSHKITEYFPVRRSSRKPEAQIKKEKEQNVQEAIASGSQDGLKMMVSPTKGRGIVATRNFSRGDFVIEYRGDLINRATAKERERTYELDETVGCYMYYFTYKNKNYCVDATAEGDHWGRLVNHSAKRPNLVTKTIEVKGKPHLILVAKKQIKEGDELLYDYGERNREAVESHPWLISS